MSEITLKLETWQYNAGIVGLCNILEWANYKLEDNIFEDKIVFDSSMLENFEEKYFGYMIEKYEKTLSWYKITSYKNELEDIKNNFENFDNKKLENLNNYIKEVLKKYVTSASYKAAYELIEGDINPLELEKNIKTIAIKKNEKIEEKKTEILDTINKILVLINYCEKGKKYLAGKNVIYTLIKNAWNGVSFLNPQTKEKDIYKDFKTYFLDTATNYINEDKTKHKYECFICENKIKNFDNDFSFLNQTGFDTARKPSHAWNFINNAAMCPICKLVYACIPAGFNYVYGNGIFINSNRNLYELRRVNKIIYEEIYTQNNKEKNGSSLTYKALAQALKTSKEDSLKYELADVQMVRYEEEKYYFNILSKNIIKIIRESQKDFEAFSKAWYREIKTDFRVYEDVMKRVLNNQNLNTLIYKLLYYKISRESDCHFSLENIMNMININFRILEGVGLMKDKNIDMNKEAKAAGFYLKEKYKFRNTEHKISGLCYRILNGIKTGNKSMVMDTILNMYMYAESPVPNIVVKMLDDKESLENFGYAFTAGLLSEKYQKNDSDNSDNKEEN